jgi:hypothetical protein
MTVLAKLARLFEAEMTAKERSAPSRPACRHPAQGAA